jgi:hypothetical protein
MCYLFICVLSKDFVSSSENMVYNYKTIVLKFLESVWRKDVPNFVYIGFTTQKFMQRLRKITNISEK